MNYSSPFPTFATPVLNQLAASLWLSLLGTFKITDTLGLMMLEQLAFAHWAAQELGRKQSRDLAAGADPDSPAMLRLSRERRAECRLQAQLARQLNQHLRSQAAETSTPVNSSARIAPKPVTKSDVSANLIAKSSNISYSSTKPGRNQPCPCQSGRKYKHCCLNQPQTMAA